tara:strand:- start:1223 stop:1714 length:492 start_codon:yes stop_codon:yes gene_type:complete
MITFKQFMLEMKKPKWEIPDEPGTKPIPRGHVRLYHQTQKKNLSNIRRKGILPHQPVEGPRGIYADTKGFYGKPSETPTAEFSVHKKDWHAPFVHRDKVEKKKLIATHKDWHQTVRYIDDNAETKKRVLSGEHDDLIGKGKSDKFAKAVRFVKRRERAKGKEE